MTVRLFIISGQPCQVKYIATNGAVTIYDYTTYYPQVEGFGPAFGIPVFTLESGVNLPSIDILGYNGTVYPGYAISAPGETNIGSRVSPPSVSEIWNQFPATYYGYPFSGLFYSNMGYWTDSDTGEAIYFAFPCLKKQITVTFNANGGTVSPTSMQTTSSSVISWYTDAGTITDFPTPTLSGMEFIGWFSEAVGGTQVIARSRMISLDSHTLYAHWGAVVTLDANGGTVSPASISVEPGGPYGELPTPVWSNSDFVGWFTAAVGGTQILPETVVPSNPPATLYAHWIQIFCTIVFDAQGGVSMGPDNEYLYFIRVKTGEAYGTLPTAVRSGHNFVGWFTAATGGTQVFSSTVFTLGKDQILYARWDSTTQITVYFNGNGGSVEESKRYVVVGTAIGTMPTASRSGYTLAAWKDANGNEVTENTIMPPRNLWVYAQWTGNSCTLTFNAAGGTVSPSTKNCTIGSIAGALPTPTRTGYSFLGWFTAPTGGDRFTDATVMNGNQTVYAHWDHFSRVDWWIIDIS